MNCKKLTAVFVILFSSISYSQKHFTYKVPGYLGKKMYVTAGLGNSTLVLLNPYGSALSSMSGYAGFNYTAGRKVDLGVKAVYSYNDVLNYSTYMVQGRILSSSQIAPLGSRVGIGFQYGVLTSTVDNVTRSYNTSGISIIVEKNYALSNNLLITYGVEMGFIANKEFSNDLAILEVENNILRLNVGLCYMLF